MAAQDDHLERIEELVRRGDAYWLIYASDYGLFADEDSSARAVDAIRRIGPNAIPELVRALNDLPMRWRIGIRGGLPPKPERDLADFVIDKQIQDELKNGEPNPCAPLLPAFLAIGSACVLPLARFLRDGDWLGKIIAVEALGHLAGRDVIPALKEQKSWLGVDPLSVAVRSAIRSIKKRR